MSDPLKPTQTGPNRTGIAHSPIDAKQAIATARSVTSRATPYGLALQHVRLHNAARTANDALTDNQLAVFFELLGDRLASERTGIRLYHALLVKLESEHAHPGGPTREQLEHIRDEETEHLMLVREAIDALGGDPTAVPASADVIGVAGSGWVQVLSDPRRTWLESLKVLLAAELVDNDAWRALVDLAEGLGRSRLAADFRRALDDEGSHLVQVRAWLTAAINGEAGIAPRSRDADIWLP
jgi:rubrerythrin